VTRARTQTQRRQSQMATEKRSEHAISAMSDTDPLLLEQAAACWKDVQLVKELCPIFKRCRDTSKAHAIRPVLCSKIEQIIIYLKDSTITWLHQHGQQEQPVQHALSQMPRVLSIWERLTNDEVWRISPVSAHIKEVRSRPETRNPLSIGSTEIGSTEKGTVSEACGATTTSGPKHDRYQPRNTHRPGRRDRHVEFDHRAWPPGRCC